MTQVHYPTCRACQVRHDPMARCELVADAMRIALEVSGGAQGPRRLHVEQKVVHSDRSKDRHRQTNERRFYLMLRTQAARAIAAGKASRWPRT